MRRVFNISVPVVFLSMGMLDNTETTQRRADG